MLTVADTAYSIAAVRAEEHAKPPEQRLFEDPYAAIFRAAGAHAEDGTRRFLDLPFFRDGIRLRTRFIDDVLRAALVEGIDQVVLLGAGFDARALRMAELAAHRTRVYEVDFAAQLDRKRALLEAASVVVPDSIAYVACDFSARELERELATALASHGFRRDGGALFIWEGVTTYLDLDAVDRTLRVMVLLGGRSSTAVFDFGASRFSPDGVVAHALRAGFKACEDHGCDALWRCYLEGEPHPAAAFVRLAVARV